MARCRRVGKRPEVVGTSRTSFHVASRHRAIARRRPGWLPGHLGSRRFGVTAGRIVVGRGRCRRRCPGLGAGSRRNGGRRGQFGRWRANRDNLSDFSSGLSVSRRFERLGLHGRIGWARRSATRRQRCPSHQPSDDRPHNPLFRHRRPWPRPGAIAGRQEVGAAAGKTRSRCGCGTGRATAWSNPRFYKGLPVPKRSPNYLARTCTWPKACAQAMRIGNCLLA